MRKKEKIINGVSVTLTKTRVKNSVCFTLSVPSRLPIYIFIYYVCNN